MSTLTTPYGTLSFPFLFTPKPRAEGNEPDYHCSILFGVAEQKSKEFKALQDAVVALAKEKFGEKVSMSSLVSPFKDGSTKVDKYPDYEDTVFISPWTKMKPGIVDARLQDVLLPEEVYAGQVVRANVTPFAWTNSGKRGISFGLVNLQIVKKDAPRIDGRVPANKAFDAIEEEEEIPF